MIIYQTWSFYFLSSIYQLDDAGDHLETQLNRKAPSLVNDLGVYFWPLVIVIDHSRVGQKYILVFPEYVGKINTKNTKKKYKNTKSAVTCSKTVF